MKQCTYCGKEFPDAAASCDIDGHPLEPLVNPAPGKGVWWWVIIRFGFAAGLLSACCALALAYPGGAILLYGFATPLATLIMGTERSELTEPTPRRTRWVTFGACFALIAGVVWAYYHAHAVERVMSHPAFVVAFWLIMMWGLFKGYQIQKQRHDA